MAVATRPLLEREEDLRALHALLEAAAAGAGGILVVEGPAGIGKTQLLRAAADAAPPRGLRALVARAAELERSFPFGVARQLVEPSLLGATGEARAALLQGAARRGAEALDVGSGLLGDTEPSAAVHGLFWLVANLAAEAPLLLAVDDVQWADDPSLRFLAYLARRLEGLPVALVLAQRTGEPVPDALEAILAEPGVGHVAPAPLGPDAVARLVEEQLRAPADRVFADACRRQTAGNPFLLAELTAELAARGLAPTREGSAVVDALVPARVAAAARRRLAALGEAPQALARALVVLGDGAEVGLAAVLAGLGAHAAADAAARLADADLLEPGPALRFRHPLLRAAVAEAVGEAERGRAHARAARLLAERGAPPARVSTHLLASPAGDGDPWAVATLREAARAARRQGAPEQALAPLRRALAEPPDAHARPGLLRELGRAELAGMRRPAAEHLRAAYDLEADPGERADIALELGVALYGASDHAGAVDALLHALERLGEDPGHREHRLRLEAFLAVAGRYDLATEGRVRGRVHRVAAGLAGATPGERLVLAVAATEDPGPAAEGLVRAAQLQERTAAEMPWPDPSEGVGTVAMYVHAGRPDLARALADRLLERARATHSPVRRALGLFASGTVHADVGALDEAEADVRGALAASEGLGVALATGVGQLVLVLAERGALPEAQALLAAHDLEGDLPAQMILNPLLHARASLRLAQGRWEDAAADALELGARHERWGMRRPSPNWRALAAEALRAQGDLARARALAEDSLALARAWGTPKALAIALRARALAGEDPGRLADLEAAHAALAGTPWRLEAARAGADLGAALRRAGRRREAREHLGAAMDLAHACGAHGLAGRAAEELRATGARPRRHAVTGRDALTASEKRVAALAAQGLSNRQIAQELFVTLATVETHLRRVYRKLGIEGRGGLRAAAERAASA